MGVEGADQRPAARAEQSTVVRGCVELPAQHLADRTAESVGRLLVSGFVRNEETLTTDIVAKIVASGQPPENYGRQLARLVDQASFPSVYAAVVSGALEDENFAGSRLGRRVRLRARAHPRRHRGLHPQPAPAEVAKWNRR